MEIPLQASVECTDGVYGRSVYVLINPVSGKVTHLVVKADAWPHTENIVPVEAVSESVADTIMLRCSKAEVAQMEAFVRTEFVEEPIPPARPDFASYGMGSYYYWPYVGAPETMMVPVEHQQVPPGELAVRRGDRVKALDGDVGRVDEFVINPENDRITHLVMREGHLWGQRDVLIPLSAIDETKTDTVTLKLDKSQIEALPTFPVHRLW